MSAPCSARGACPFVCVSAFSYLLYMYDRFVLYCSTVRYAKKGGHDEPRTTEERTKTYLIYRIFLTNRPRGAGICVIAIAF